MKAAVYVRISKDKEGREVGVRRQEKDARALAAEKGWEAAEVYKDNDVSATSGRARRGWERMLKDLEARKLDAVVAYSSSRLYRRPADLQRLIDLADPKKGRRAVKIATVASGRIDLDTADGRMMAGILAQIDQGEAERTGERIRRALKDRSASGKPNVGGLAPYGYRKTGEPGNVRLEVEPGQAEVLKIAARRIIAGASWSSVAKELNVQGIKTAGGGRWTPYQLRATLTKPLTAGLLPSGTQGDWTPILSTGEREMLLRRVGNGNGNGSKDERLGARRYILTGLLRCEACGAKMMGAGGYYRCTSLRGGCGKTAVQSKVLERLVIEKVDPLDSKRWRSRKPRRTKDAEETLAKMEKLEAQIDENAGNLKLSRRTLEVRERAILDELAKLRDSLPVHDEEPPAPDPDRTQELLQAWATDSLDDRQRHLLSGFLARTVEEIRVKPGRGNVPERAGVTLRPT